MRRHDQTSLGLRVIKIGRSKRLNRIAAYLATPFARRLTGTTTYVDGGLSIMA